VKDHPVIVLGATGLLGQALLREAARRGRTSWGWSRRAGPGIDLAALDDLWPLLAPLSPSLVINAAANTDLAACERDPAGAHALHARLPGLLARCGREHGLRWVQVSTDHLYAGDANVRHTEDEPVQLLNAYARSKHAGEAQALADPAALVLRTNIVGWRGWPGQPNFAEWVLQALQRGEPFDAYTDVWASSLEVGQFAQALFDLADAGPDAGARGRLNVAARTSHSKAEFIQALAAALGLDAAALRPVPRPPAQAGSGPLRASAMGLDVTRAEQLLGRPLPALDAVVQALARTLPTHPILSKEARHASV
jgi:dTDP-4-dehydrorhamnose reductase